MRTELKYAKARLQLEVAKQKVEAIKAQLLDENPEDYDGEFLTITHSSRKGNVQWKQLAKELDINDTVQDAYRAPDIPVVTIRIKG